MSSIILTGDTSGTLTVSSPLVAGTNTLTLAAATGTLSPLVSATAVTASGTSIDFTGIPNWAKRITVMFSSISGNGVSNFLIQLGSGSPTTSGYVSYSQSSATSATSTAGFIQYYAATVAASTYSGANTISLLNSTTNTWVSSGTFASVSGAIVAANAGSVSLSGTLDRVRITTVNGTDTFDAGSINIMYEG